MRHRERNHPPLPRQMVRLLGKKKRTENRRKTYIYIYIIKELPQQAAVEGTISLAVLEKRKDWKTQEVGVKRKW